MKILHASDLHLDSPLRGLARYPGAPVARLRGATRKALANLVDLAIAEPVDLVLLAGDLYDGDWRDYGTGLAFVAEMRRLREAGIRVVSIRGNHDAASQITRDLKLPENVVDLSTSAPQTIELDRLGIAVHGQGFATQKVTDDLARKYPAPVQGALNFGLLHTAIGGREGHETYAPTSIDVLRQKGYDYWALGHIHTREVVSRAPYIVFPGNLQGRHIRETGAKGATLIHVLDGRITSVEHRALDVVRYVDIDIETKESDSEDELWERVRGALASTVDASEGRLVATRLTVRGPTQAHRLFAEKPERLEAQVRSLALDVAGDGIFVGEVRGRTRLPVDLDALSSGDDALAQIVRSVRDLTRAETMPAEVAGALDELAKAMPPALAAHPGAAFLSDPDARRAFIEDVEQAILGRLLAGRS